MAMAASSPATNRWLFGPVPDLLLGCGVLYAGLAVAFSFGGAGLRTALPTALLAGLTLLLSTPHYGATLLRVYERRQDRRAYVLFALWASLVIAAASVAAVYDAALASILVTIYLTWSPWHYTGQNYGIGVLFLRRRGVDLTGRAKQLVYGSFLLSYALVFLVMHGARGAAPDIPVPYAGDAVTFVPLGIPQPIVDVLFPMVGLAYLGCLVGWVVLLARRAPLRDLGPTLALVLTQGLWFSIPFAARHFGISIGLEPLDWRLRTHYFLWIALGHAAQYLWVTTYYARAGGGRSAARQLGGALAAGAAIWTIPAVLFSPDAFGRVGYDAGLAMVVSAGVNIHHFVLDGAIWKLRSGPIARVLVRSQPVDAIEPARPGWIRTAVWSVAGVSLACSLLIFHQEQIAGRAAIQNRDDQALAATLDRLAWFARDNAEQRLRLGARLSKAGDRAGAIEQMERSAELRPDARAYRGLALLYLRDGATADARLALERLVALEPDAVGVEALAALDRGDTQAAREQLRIKHSP